MGVSTAGVLSFNSISYSQNLVLARHVFPLLLIILTCITGLMAFQRLLLLEYGGGPEKGPRCLFLWLDSMHALPGFVLPAGCLLA